MPSSGVSEYGSSYRAEWAPDAPRPMIVTAALCWWNERPEDLVRCVAGAAQVADRIVALDGAYVRYPGATVRSDVEQTDAIRRTAEKHDLDCLILQPDRLWAGQIEKRSHLLALACVGTDWIVTLDADHIITTERDALRAELAASVSDIVDVPFVTPKGKLAAGLWHLAQTQGPQMIPQFWRASIHPTVERHHWWISATKDNQKVWAWAGDGHRKVLPHAKFVTPYVVEHRTLLRTEEQILASRAFCNDREMVVARTGQEDDLPELPRPVFDYVSVPT